MEKVRTAAAAGIIVCRPTGTIEILETRGGDVLSLEEMRSGIEGNYLELLGSSKGYTAYCSEIKSENLAPNEEATRTLVKLGFTHVEDYDLVGNVILVGKKEGSFEDWALNEAHLQEIRSITSLDRKKRKLKRSSFSMMSIPSDFRLRLLTLRSASKEALEALEAEEAEEAGGRSETKRKKIKRCKGNIENGGRETDSIEGSATPNLSKEQEEEEESFPFRFKGKGNIGGCGSDISGFCVPIIGGENEGGLHFRLDDLKNREFWLEFNISEGEFRKIAGYLPYHQTKE